jgi:hypothetical protein
VRAVPLSPRGPQGTLLRSRRKWRRPCPPPASRPPSGKRPDTKRVGQGALNNHPANTGDIQCQEIPSWICCASP